MAAPAVIEFEGVGLAYAAQSGAPTVALDDLRCRFLPGKVTAIIGPSGCGKSTMLQIARGFLDPTAGRLRFVELREPRAGRAAGDVHGVAGVQSVSVADRDRERRVRPAAWRHAGGRTPRAGEEGARGDRSHRLRREISAPALRRHAPARRAGARAGDGAGRAAARRAVRRARRADAPRAAGAARRAGRAERHHRDPGDALDRGSDPSGRHDPGDDRASRPHRGGDRGRSAAAALARHREGPGLWRAVRAHLRPAARRGDARDGRRAGRA